jgi:predicted transcriptional regulator
MSELTKTKKQAIIEMIGRMPDDLTEDDVIYALYARKKVDRGIADADAGRFATNEEVEQALSKWRTSAGR